MVTLGVGAPSAVVTLVIIETGSKLSLSDRIYTDIQRLLEAPLLDLVIVGWGLVSLQVKQQEAAQDLITKEIADTESMKKQLVSNPKKKML